MSLLPAIEIATAKEAQFAVIWLHGLGADGSDFVPVVHELGLNKDFGTRFVFPHAPYRAVTCNGGYEMRAWYDIISLEPHSRRIDEAGLVESRDAVRALIQRENERGIPSQNIFLAGFSQGGAVAYLTALTHGERLGGLIALSTYIPSQQLQFDEATPANRDLPILAAHGLHDDVVSPALGKAARDLLREAGYSLAWHEYPMPHSVCIEEVELIGDWLNARCGEIVGA
ncbi:alpha/beta hydrolase [Azonexus sp. IMCC34839]|uniref:alpha/beta hydrolase n=1 Tax=Azonexus sp. IMCC34839 TaxID=3133695 RepID=UPI00399B23E8